nr:hypothetical protein [Paenibacillus agaridevorans]
MYDLVLTITFVLRWRALHVFFECIREMAQVVKTRLQRSVNDLATVCLQQVSCFVNAVKVQVIHRRDPRKVFENPTKVGPAVGQQ